MNLMFPKFWTEHPIWCLFIGAAAGIVALTIGLCS